MLYSNRDSNTNIMRQEVIYNANYTITTPEGEVIKRKTGFLALGLEGFTNELKFINRPNTVNIKKIWTEEGIDNTNPNYVEY